MTIMKMIYNKFMISFQFIKFLIVGILNTIIDFTILNFLIWITEIYKGSMIAVFNTISFSSGIINSYIWNKYWTFHDRSSIPMQFIKFFSIAIIGLILNTMIVYSMATFITFNINPIFLANFAKTMATVVVVFWNFIGYKYLVFI